MKKIVVLVAIAFVVPSLALAARPPSPGHSAAAHQYKKPAGHAYGFYCQNQSKKHVAGTPGTPFSACVTAMAKLASGTPFSLCVSGGAHLLHDKQS